MSLRVREPGLCTMVVNGGRPRTRSLGVPVGGAADYSALIIGNCLLGNPPTAAALEITLAGPVLQAVDRTAMVVFGPPFSLICGRHRLRANQTFTLEPGDELHIGGTPHGARGYVCVAGGLQTAEILGSRSSLAPLRRDEELPCMASSCKQRMIRHEFDWPQVPSLSTKLTAGERILRILPGPEAEWFPKRGRMSFSVRPESNRMGLRLQGEPLPPAPREMVSQPMAPGTIQVTREGQLILLGVDGQSIGGYPRLAHVISADLDLVGQLRPGDKVRFREVSLEEAEILGARKRETLRRWALRIRTATVGF